MGADYIPAAPAPGGLSGADPASLTGANRAAPAPRTGRWHRAILARNAQL